MTEIEQRLADDEVLRLIEKAKKHKMSPDERFEQKVSWIYGMQDFDSPNPRTKEQIRNWLAHLEGVKEQEPPNAQLVDRRVSPLPCPHCGSDDLNGPHLTEYIGDTRHPYWWIECNKCPCGMQVDGETQQPLIDAWNKRANGTKLTGAPRNEHGEANAD